MMKFKNKKTGEVFDALIREKGGAGSYSLIVCDIKSYEQSKSTLDATHFVLDEYDSLAELNADWEDCKPAEPLIKDEKIRKAVRAWAEANDVIEVFIDRIGDGTYIELYDEDDGRRRISALRSAGLKTGEAYTIDELCGEEEE